MRHHLFDWFKWDLEAVGDSFCSYHVNCPPCPHSVRTNRTSLPLTVLRRAAASGLTHSGRARDDLWHFDFTFSLKKTRQRTKSLFTQNLQTAATLSFLSCLLVLGRRRHQEPYGRLIVAALLLQCQRPSLFIDTIKGSIVTPRSTNPCCSLAGSQ